MVQLLRVFATFVLSASSSQAIPDLTKASSQPSTSNGTPSPAHHHHGSGWYRKSSAKLTVKDHDPHAHNKGLGTTPAPKVLDEAAGTPATVPPQVPPQPDTFLARNAKTPPVISGAKGNSGNHENDNKHHGSTQAPRGGKINAPGGFETRGDEDYNDGKSPHNVVKNNHTYAGDPEENQRPTRLVTPITSTTLPTAVPFPDDVTSENPLPAGAPACFRSPLIHRDYTKLPSCVVKMMDDLPGCMRSPVIVLENLKVPPKTTLLLNNLQDQTIVIKGTIEFLPEKDVDMSKSHTAKPTFSGRLMAVTGNNVRLTGYQPDDLTAFGTLLAHGEKYWDELGDRGVAKPKVLHLVGCHNLLVDHLTIKNAPVQACAIASSTMVQIQEVRFDNKAADGDVEHRLGRNTDCMDFSNVKTVTVNRVVAWSQDDFVAVNSGQDICIINSFAANTHGISVGSLGNNDLVQNFYAGHNVLIQSMYGFRIKAKSGQNGMVKGFILDSNKVYGAKQAILGFFQNYNGGTTSGPPSSSSMFTGITVRNNKGSGRQISQIALNGKNSVDSIHSNDFQALLRSNIQSPNTKLLALDL